VARVAAFFWVQSPVRDLRAARAAVRPRLPVQQLTARLGGTDAEVLARAASITTYNGLKTDSAAHRIDREYRMHRGEVRKGGPVMWPLLLTPSSR
jgi:hypothetical protein